MEKMKNKGLIEREQKMRYKNFNVAVYCPVGNVNEIQDLEEFDRRFALLYKNVKLGRAYLECFRGMEWATKEQLLKVRLILRVKELPPQAALPPVRQTRMMDLIPCVIPVMRMWKSFVRLLR